MSIEVAAVDPATGAAKLLAPAELEGLIALLAEFDEALTREITFSKSGGALEMSTVNRYSRKFRAFGLDPGWFEKGPDAAKPLFLARSRDKETPVFRLKDLLELAGAAKAPETPSDAPRPADKLIFVVDDDDSIREMIGYVFKKEGFKVENFPDGVAMQDGIRAGGRPDMIVMDMMMPKQGGYEVLRELQMGETGDIPVIVITGRSLDAQMAAMLRQERNVAEFMEKPLVAKALLAAAHKILKTARA